MSKVFLFIFVFLSIIFAVGPNQVKLLEPYPTLINSGDEVDMGYIGPGQTFSVMISSKVDSGGIYGDGGNWDIFYVDELPEGWKASVSGFGPKLKVNVKVSPEAKEGIYYLMMAVEDDGHREQIGDLLKFRVKIEVKRDLVDVQVIPTKLTVSAGSPARFKIFVTNPSTASDVFLVKTKNVPGWNFTKKVFIPFRGSVALDYEVVNKEEDNINFKIYVVSTSSDLISAEKNVNLITKSDPFYDLLSTNNGLLLYPPMEFLVYNFYQIIASFYELFDL